MNYKQEQTEKMIRYTVSCIAKHLKEGRSIDHYDIMEAYDSEAWNGLKEEIAGILGFTFDCYNADEEHKATSEDDPKLLKNAVRFNEVDCRMYFETEVLNPAEAIIDYHLSNLITDRIF